MEKRKFGNSGLQVSRLGLGCMGMSEFYGSYNDNESIKVIHYAIDIGINFFDTADMYGQGKNEILVGKALKDKRTLLNETESKEFIEKFGFDTTNPIVAKNENEVAKIAKKNWLSSSHENPFPRYIP